MVIDLVRAERGNILVVQRVGRSHARGRNLALKQFEFDIARDILLRAVHECGQRFAERGVPLAVVNKVGEFKCDVFFKMRGVAVERNFFEVFVRLGEIPVYAA